MIEGRLKPDLARQQHTVAEYVAGHVADTDHGKGFLLDVGAQFAEMTLDPFPGALGGYSHALVVVSDRTARGKGITQPEPPGKRHSRTTPSG